MSNAAQGAAAGSKPIRRHGRRGWMLRLFFVYSLLIVLVLMAGGAVAVQLLLQSDWPRQYVLRRLAQQSGLRIEAAELRTGWWGESVARDVSAALPLADQPFIAAATVHVRHSGVISLLLQRPLTIERIEIESPQITLERTASARWNLMEAMSISTRSTGGPSATLGQARKTAAQLPQIVIRSGSLAIHSGGRSSVVRPVHFTGAPASVVSWRFSGSVDNVAEFSGQLSPTQNWRHDVMLNVSNAAALLSPWIDEMPRDAQAAGAWHGRISGNAIMGQFQIDAARAAGVELAGGGQAQWRQGILRVNPQALSVRSARLPGEVDLSGGVIDIGNDAMSFESVRLRLLSGFAEVSGRLDPQQRQLHAEGRWVDLSFPNFAGHAPAESAGPTTLPSLTNLRHSGQIVFDLRTPWPNRPVIDLRLDSRGSAGSTTWQTRLVALGRGESWRRFDWEIAFPSTHVSTPAGSAEIGAVRAELLTTDGTVRLRSFTASDPLHLAARGEYDWREHTGWLWLDAQALPLPWIQRQADVTFGAVVSPGRIDVSQAQFEAGRVSASAHGSYVFGAAKPFEGSVSLWQVPIAVQESGGRTKLTGGVRAEVHATGALWPLNVGLTGQLAGSEVVVGSRELGNVSAQLSGSLDSEAVHVETTQLSLLDAQWKLSAGYRFSETEADLGVSVQDLSLKLAESLVRMPLEASGVLSGQFHARWRPGDIDGPTVAGEWRISGFERGPVRADTAAGRLTFSDQRLALDDVKLTHGKGLATGSYRQARRLSTSELVIDVREWPLEVPNQSTKLTLTGGASLQINRPTNSISGPVKLSGAAFSDTAKLFSMYAKGEFAGRHVDVKQVQIAALSGSADGQGVIDLDQWVRSKGTLVWRGINADRVIALWPAASGLVGEYTGTLLFGPETDPSNTMRLAVQVQIETADGSYRGLKLGSGNGKLLLEPDRLVVENSSLSVAGGAVQAWARASMQDEDLFGHVQLEMAGLDLNEIVHAFAPESESMIGRLDGKLSFFGNPSRLDQISGRGVLSVAGADLAHSDIVASLYDAMKLRVADGAPTGAGRVELHLEKQSLHVSNLIYRNRGVEIRAAGTMDDVFAGARSPVRGYAVGTARPLRELKLPFAADLDDILNALQQAATTVQIGGTLGRPEQKIATFSEIGESLRQFVVGEAR